MLSVISAVIAVAAAIAAATQVWVTRRSGHQSMVHAVLNALYDEELRGHRRRVYQLSYTSVDEWADDQVRSAEIVASDAERLGFLLKNGYLGSGRFLDGWGPGIYRTYAILEPYVEAERRRLNSPAYWVHYEWLARRAIDRKVSATPWWERAAWGRTRRREPSVADRVGALEPPAGEAMSSPVSSAAAPTEVSTPRADPPPPDRPAPRG